VTQSTSRRRRGPSGPSGFAGKAAFGWSAVGRRPRPRCHVPVAKCASRARRSPTASDDARRTPPGPAADGDPRGTPPGARGGRRRASNSTGGPRRTATRGELHRRPRGGRRRAVNSDAEGENGAGARLTPAPEAKTSPVRAELRRRRAVSALERQGAPPCAAWRHVGARGTRGARRTAGCERESTSSDRPRRDDVGAAPGIGRRRTDTRAPTKPPGRRVGRDAPALPCARRAPMREPIGATARRELRRRRRDGRRRTATYGELRRRRRERHRRALNSGADARCPHGSAKARLRARLGGTSGRAARRRATDDGVRTRIDVGGSTSAGRRRRGPRHRPTSHGHTRPHEAAGPSRRTRRPGAPMRAAGADA
jgi:hypothetical protein